MANIYIKVNGSFPKALQEFKRRSGFILREYKESQYFVPASVKRQLKRKRKLKKSREYSR